MLGMGLALLDPSIFADTNDGDQVEQDDPRRKLIKMAALDQLAGGANDNETVATSGNANAAPGAGEGSTTTASPADKLERAAAIPPMPSTFPASTARSSAADRLQRSRRPFESQGWKSDLVRGLLTALPAVIGGGKGAEGAVQGAEIARSHDIQNRQVAEQEYQFEAGREERERDQAIKERLAEAQIQSQAAYRTLMAGIANRRADTGQQNADTRSGTAAVNERAKGMMVVKGDDGVSRVVDIPPDMLPTIQRAQLGVQQATEELKKAQTAAIPQQIEIARSRLDIQSKMLQKSLAALEITRRNSERADAQFGVNYGITPQGEPSDLPDRIPGAMTDREGTPLPMKVAGQLGPGGFEKSRAGAAQNVIDTAGETSKLIRANKGVLGPIWGRVSIAGLAAGSLPNIVMSAEQREALEKISTSMQSTYSFASTAHGWRSSEAPMKFEQAIGGLARDPEMTATGLDTLAHNMEGVVKGGSTARVSGGGAASKLKKRQPANTATPPANTPPAPKVRSWREFVAQ